MMNPSPLRTREHLGLPMDLCPSIRCMRLLVEGAHDMGLAPHYHDWLATHPVYHISWILAQTRPPQRYFYVWRSHYENEMADSTPLLELAVLEGYTCPWRPWHGKDSKRKALLALCGGIIQAAPFISGTCFLKMIETLEKWEEIPPRKDHRGIGHHHERILN